MSETKKSADFFMERAFEIAAQVDPHRTAPNPRVGCVVVKNNQIVAEGVHEYFGGPHAEANACQSLTDLADCEVYITLEPCDIFSGKKTPSCTDLLLKKGPKKIFIGALDLTFCGKNVEKIKAQNIPVQGLDYEKKNKSINPFFPIQKKPYLCLKIAQTLDGKINHDDQKYSDGKAYLSNETSRQRVHELRAQYSAVLTSTETVLKDNPQLNVRLKNFDRPFSDPSIVILGDRQIPKNLPIFSIPNRDIHSFPRQDLKKTLTECAENLHLDSILLEVGHQLSTAFLTQDLVDEIQFFIAPKITGQGLSGFQSAVSLTNFSLAEKADLGGDIWMRFKKN